MIIIEIAFFGALCIFGARGLAKKKKWRELTVFLILFLAGSAILVLLTAGTELPYLTDQVELFFRNVLHLSLD